MNLIKSSAILFVLSGLIPGVTAYAENVGQSSLMKSQPGTSKNRGEAILQYLRDAAGSEKVAVRINYHGSCKASVDYPVSIPEMDLHKPLEGRTGVRAIRDIFDGNKNVSVTVDSNGLIDVNIGNINKNILETKISVLHFSPLQQYNPNLAIGAIMNAKPVVAVMHDLNVELSLVILQTLLVQPATSLPHLPIVMKDVSVNHVLNDIAHSFNGYVFYGECRKSNGAGVIDIYFSN